jgi:hypothetical protein
MSEPTTEQRLKWSEAQSLRDCAYDGWHQIKTSYYNEMLQERKQMRDALEEIAAQLNGVEGRIYKWIRERAQFALREK